jgi:hypothetical protein
MERLRALATRLGAVVLLGSLVAWVGDDRLGLVASDRGEMWATVALLGVFLNGTGWALLGAVLALGSRRTRHRTA